MATGFWRDRAACAGTEPDAWFPMDQSGIAWCRSICNRCPVRDACLADAMREEAGQSRWHMIGIRGGLTPAERDALRGGNRERTISWADFVPAARGTSCPADDPRHGDEGSRGYFQGCRGLECTAAQRNHQRRRRGQAVSA